MKQYTIQIDPKDTMKAFNLIFQRNEKFWCLEDNTYIVGNDNYERLKEGKVKFTELKLIIKKEFTIDEKKEKLWNFCRKFIDKNDIVCGEDVWQCDTISEQALSFLDSVCEMVGYKEDDEE